MPPVTTASCPASDMTFGLQKSAALQHDGNKELKARVGAGAKVKMATPAVSAQLRSAEHDCNRFKECAIYKSHATCLPPLFKEEVMRGQEMWAFRGRVQVGVAAFVCTRIVMTKCRKMSGKRWAEAGLAGAKTISLGGRQSKDKI